MRERVRSLSLFNRIDEKRMCERLLSVTGNKSEPLVVVNGWEEDWDTSTDPLDWKSRMRSSPKRDSIVCVSDGNHF